jgi:protein SCO1/2
MAAGARSRTALGLALLPVLAAGAAACAQPGREQPEPRRADAARLMNELMSGRHPIGGPFTLSAPDGRRVSLGDFRGKLVLLYFGYVHCPDVCPTDLAAVSAALEALGTQAAEVQPLFVTLDPDRDTPEVLREYVAAFHPRFIALTGSEAEVRRIATVYKVFYERVPQPGASGYAIDHTAFTFLLDRDGNFHSLFPPGTPPQRIATMLRELLTPFPAN